LWRKRCYKNTTDGIIIDDNIAILNIKCLNDKDLEFPHQEIYI
jgi:hypothetical protein